VIPDHTTFLEEGPMDKRMTTFGMNRKDMPIDVFRAAEGVINYLRAGRMSRFNPKAHA
jgi:hypothetical protein